MHLNSSIWTDPNVDLADVSISFVEEKFMPADAVVLAAAVVVLVGAQSETSARRIEVQGKYSLWDCQVIDVTRLGT